MADLSSFRKVDIQDLAREFGIEPLTNDRVVDLINKIENAPGYNKEVALSQVKFIMEDRLEKIEEEKNRVAEEKNRVAEEKAEENLRLEREAERKHEIEKIRAGQEADAASLSSVRSERSPKIALKSIMQKFDPEKSDMALFLNLFERQAKKSNIEEDEWVTQLLQLIPVQIAELILREPEEMSDNFEYVKEKLLERFKLSPEAFRSKFVTQQRRPDSLWKDMIFELRGYLNGWLTGLKISSLEGLKDLMICDQIKRRTPSEIKERLIDSWAKYTDPLELANKLDEHEEVRKSLKKTINFKSQEREKVFDKNRGNGKYRAEEKPRNDTPNWRDKKTNDQNDKEKIFEKRKPLLCYHCKSSEHLRYNCPELKESNTGYVNNVRVGSELGPSFKPYLSTAKLNNTEVTVLRDTGTDLDIVSRNLINQNQLNGETIWVRQALEDQFHCLPLADIELQIENVGKVKTKAAVLKIGIERKHYLLGNKTQKLIEAQKREPKLVNTIPKLSLTKYDEKNGSLSTESNVEREEERLLFEPNSELVTGSPPPRENENEDLAEARPREFSVE